MRTFKSVDEFVAAFPDKSASISKEKAKEFYELYTQMQDALAIPSDLTKGSWDYELGSYGGKKFWSEDCESAKLDKFIELAPSIWENIYGLKDAKEILKTAADIDNASEDKRDELQKALDKAIAKLDEDYKEGTIKSVEAVNKSVAETTRELKTLNPSSFEDCTVTLEKSEFVYDGTAKEPAVTVKNGDEIVSADDYTVEYKDNKDAGTATVTVTGKNIYTGQKEVQFTITPAEQELKVAETTYNKTAGDAAFALNATSSVEGAELTYTSDNEKVATVDKDGKVTPVAEGTAVITVKATAENYKEATATVTVKVAKKAETPVPGKDNTTGNTTVTPAPTQTPSTTTVETYKILNVAKKAVTKTEGNKAFNLGVKTKVKGSVAYKTSNKKVVTVDKKGKVTVKGPGRAVITVTGKANGLKTETAKITVTVKPSAKLSAKVAAQSGNKLQVTWKRNKKATGYQIVVATDKSFKHVVKTVNVKKNKTVKATVKGLKGGQKYYVRVRSFKKASGGNVYGNWAKTKPVKAVK